MSSKTEQFLTTYKERLNKVIVGISNKEIESFIDILLQARSKRSMIYFIGNGGSASTASHFTNDLSVGLKNIADPFQAISLCDNVSIITAIGNDYGYEYIFSKQLEPLLKKDDVVVAISASGNSENLIRAINFTKERQAVSVGITAFDGGVLKSISDISVHVPTDIGEYGVAEDAHMMLDHLITSYMAKVIPSEK